MSQYYSATSVRFNIGPLESYSGNASNQDTASKQHHSRIEITTKNMIDHMLSEQLYFFFNSFSYMSYLGPDQYQNGVPTV